MKLIEIWNRENFYPRLTHGLVFITAQVKSLGATGHFIQFKTELDGIVVVLVRIGIKVLIIVNNFKYGINIKMYTYLKNEIVKDRNRIFP